MVCPRNRKLEHSRLDGADAASHTATLMQNGHVLVTGGWTG